jgi:hypothetical protein
MSLHEAAQVLSTQVILSCVDVHGRSCEQPVTAHDLSQQGARLDGIKQALAPGARVTLRYGGAVVEAHIVWVVVSARAECQVGVRLLDPKRCPWKSLLGEPEHMRRLPERRKAKRYRVSIGVEVSDEAERLAMRTSTVDISMGGCYIETLFPLPVGANVNVLLWLGSNKLLAKGTVRTSYPGVGMGIEFVGLAWEDSQRLDRFLQDNRAGTL